MIRVDRNLWRCYLVGRRLHHGLVGAIFVGVGVGLALHDLKDFPWRFVPDRS